MLAFADLSVAHMVAHSLIFIGYIVACLIVPATIRALIALRTKTTVAGATFFITCGITHFALVFNIEAQEWVKVNDHLQAVAIISFVFLLSQDLTRALTRLRVAFKALAEQEGPDVALRVAETIQTSLGGKRAPH